MADEAKDTTTKLTVFVLPAGETEGIAFEDVDSVSFISGDSDGEPPITGRGVFVNPDKVSVIVVEKEGEEPEEEEPEEEPEAEAEEEEEKRRARSPRRRSPTKRSPRTSRRRSLPPGASPGPSRSRSRRRSPSRRSNHAAGADARRPNQGAHSTAADPGAVRGRPSPRQADPGGVMRRTPAWSPPRRPLTPVGGRRSFGYRPAMPDSDPAPAFTLAAADRLLASVAAQWQAMDWVEHDAWLAYDDEHEQFDRVDQFLSRLMYAAWHADRGQPVGEPRPQAVEGPQARAAARARRGRPPDRRRRRAHAAELRGLPGRRRVVSAMCPGELDALRWTDLDFTPGAEAIRVERRWNVKVRKITAPKHGSVRTVAFVEPLHARLLALRRESEWAFTTVRGGHYTPSSRGPPLEPRARADRSRQHLAVRGDPSLLRLVRAQRARAARPRRGAPARPRRRRDARARAPTGTPTRR